MSELEVNLCDLYQTERVEVHNVTSETLTVDVSDAQNIDVLWGDSAQIDVPIALQYIRSGQKEIDNYISTSLPEVLATKQDVISDLSIIRSGSALGATSVQPSELATVATTGSYTDLLNKPTIPAAQVNSDWNAVSGVAEILNKPSLATVATSGSYNDLSDKPAIPTVNNATLTLTQGGVSKGTFTANASSNVTIALDAAESSLPSQTGNAGKFLITDGTDASWESVAHVIETYVNGTDWYRLWSDGWCEQGGVTTIMSNTVTLLKEMADTNYTVTVTCRRSTNPVTQEGNACGYAVSTTQAFICSGASYYGAYWTVCGYIGE